MACVMMGPPVKTGRSSMTIMGGSTATMMITTVGTATTTTGTVTTTMTFLAPVCEKGTDCTDCGGADPDAPTVECTNTCQWANDDYCDDTRTSGLCDRGPASKGNFTTFDDDGWWDDDENYWDDDYDR